MVTKIFALLTLVLLWAVGVSGCSGCDDQSRNEELVVLTEISVGNTDVRSCDIAFALSRADSSLVVVFPDDVRGRYDARSSRLAVSFIPELDQPFRGAAASIQASASSDESTRPVVFELLAAKCFDWFGQPVAEPDLRW